MDSAIIMHGMRSEQIELTIQINEIMQSGSYGVPTGGTHYTISHLIEFHTQTQKESPSMLCCSPSPFVIARDNITPPCILDKAGSCCGHRAMGHVSYVDASIGVLASWGWGVNCNLA